MAPRLSHQQRQQIIDLKAKGYRINDINRITGISRKSVYMWLNRYEETGGYLIARHRQNYQRSTTEEQDAEIIATHLAQPYLDTKETAQQFNISNDTVRRRLREVGFRQYLSPAKMPSCVLKWCRNHTDFNNVGITFHKFPTNETQKAKWINAVRLERRDDTWLPSKRSVLCSLHFLETDVYIPNNGRRRLKKTAIPIFMDKKSARPSMLMMAAKRKKREKAKASRGGPSSESFDEDSESQVADYGSEDENSLLKPRGSSHEVPVYTPSQFSLSSQLHVTNENPEDDHCKSCFQLLDSAACRYVCVECAWQSCPACEAAGAHAAHAVLRAPPNRTLSEINTILRLVREQIILLQETGQINSVKLESEEEENTDPLQFAEATIADSFNIDIVKEEPPLEDEENGFNENVDDEDHSTTISSYSKPQAPTATGGQTLQNVTPANLPMSVQSTHKSVKRTMTIPQTVVQAKVSKPGASPLKPGASLLKPGINVPNSGLSVATPGLSIVIKPGLNIEISPGSSNVSEPGPSLMTSSTVVTKTGTGKVRKKVTPARPAPKIDIASDDDATSDMSIKSEPESEGEEIIT